MFLLVRPGRCARTAAAAAINSALGKWSAGCL